MITPKVRKAELSFLYMTRRLVLFYIVTMYHQNIPKVIQVTERTRSLTLTLTPTGSVPKNNMSTLPPFGSGGHNKRISSPDLLIFSKFHRHILKNLTMLFPKIFISGSEKIGVGLKKQVANFLFQFHTEKGSSLFLF